jgi:DNA-directed RNA polymerase subunit M/transcription elongation factor TFIIS
MSENESISKYCRNCAYTKKIENVENLTVSKISFKKNESNTDINKYINEYTKFDPSLPRAPNSMHCPKCNANENIVMFRYDEINLKYLYICVSETCNNFVFTIHD